METLEKALGMSEKCRKRVNRLKIELETSEKGLKRTGIAQKCRKKELKVKKNRKPLLKKTMEEGPLKSHSAYN